MSKTGEPYKCVSHGVHHGFYEAVKNDLVYWEDKTNPGNPVKGGKPGLSILQAEELLGYMARSAVKVDNKSLVEPKDLTKIKTPKPEEKNNANPNWKEKVEEIKKKLIPKDDTVIIFDESHFSDSKYQEIQKRLVANGYKVIIMSATFPKKKFSITTSHSRPV